MRLLACREWRGSWRSSTAEKYCAPRTAFPEVGATGIASCCACHWLNSAGVCATTRMRIHACSAPQYSAQVPKYVPGVSAENHTRFSTPGIMSILRPNSGTQNRGSRQRKAREGAAALRWEHESHSPSRCQCRDTELPTTIDVRRPRAYLVGSFAGQRHSWSGWRRS